MKRPQKKISFIYSMNLKLRKLSIIAATFHYLGEVWEIQKLEVHALDPLLNPLLGEAPPE